MKKALLILFVTFASLANAAYFNLADAPYNLSQADYTTKVSDRYATGKDTLALPYAWAALHGSEWGLTYSQFRGLYLFSAVFTDAGWHGEGKGNTARGYLNEFNFVDVPNGRYQSTVSLTIPRGGFRGTGTFGYYLGSGAWTTEFTMDDAHWIDTDRLWHERVLFSTPQWNDETNYSYNESYTVENIHLSGPDKADGITRIGIAFGRSGEASKWDMIKSDGWSYGIVARQGVPMSGGTCSVFGNSIAGFAGIGCALASMRIDVISGDRNGSLIALLPGYGAASGGSLDIGLAGAEDANPQGGGGYGSQIVGRFEGQFHVTIANVRYSCDTRLNDAIFVVNPVIKSNPEWGTQGSYLGASGNGFHYNTLLHNLATSTRRANAPDYNSWSFEWFANGDKFASNGPGDWSAKPAGPVALASLARDPMTGAAIGSWDYANGTPARVDNVGTPSNCVWTWNTWSAWSPCINGQQQHTRTVTSTGDCTGTTPPPSIEYQACGSNPPPACTFTYTVTSTCTDGKWKTRTAKASPSNCTGTAPADSLSRTCAVIPPSGTIPPRSQWTVTASSNYPQWPISNLTDGSITSRWTTGGKQMGGEWMIVDLGTTAPVSKVTMDAGGSYYDCPVAYSIQTSTDGTNWTTKATGKGNVNSRAPIVATFAATSTRYVRILQTGTNTGNWWTMMELTIE
ncbi:MAG: discoidin domain-containing protein [Flavobacteriales bacterium]|nr:discoidin domain-containing protein [Flavobacteriales bacterium]